jgi:hypothetical protein
MNGSVRTNSLGTAPTATATLLLAIAATAAGAELHPDTLQSFNRYVRATETRRDAERGDTFLWIDRITGDRRATFLRTLSRGDVVIERLETRDRGGRIDIPSGIVHHWIATVFIPRVGLATVVDLAEDYDRHAEIFQPVVNRSRLVRRDGSRFDIYYRFLQKYVITVVMDVYSEARFTTIDLSRVEARVYSNRIVEVDNAGLADERTSQPDDGHGYLWRLNTYCRFQERDGGVYIEFETLSLTRDLPIGVGWIIRPFVTRVPRESLVFTLETYQKRLGRRG